MLDFAWLSCSACYADSVISDSQFSVACDALMVKHSWISMQQEHQCLFRMLLELSQLLAGFKFPDSNTASTILVSRLWQVKRITAWNSVHDISICNINMFVMTLKELCLAANDQGYSICRMQISWGAAYSGWLDYRRWWYTRINMRNNQTSKLHAQLS